MGKVRQKMPRLQRAKQFMPFAALKGLEEALARAEWSAAARRQPAADPDPLQAEGSGPARDC